MKLINLLLVGLSFNPLVNENLYSQDKVEKPLDIEVEDKEVIKPSLEEIAELLSKTPQEILQPSVDIGLIKKFEYTKQTKPEEFYKFLKGFDNKIIFGVVYIDRKTFKRNPDFLTSEGTHDSKVSSASAIVFNYINRNLENNSKVGFFFLELNDFYGEESWRRLYKTFNIKSLDIPSWAEYKKEGENYKLIDFGSAGILPEDIGKYIELNVKEYSKK